MPKLALAPLDMLKRKPAHGSPCTNCGLCCVVTRCQIGKQLFGEGGQCPALVKCGDHAYSCGIVNEIEDDELRRAALLLIRAGEGCDARFNGEWINRAFHRQQDKTDAKNADAIRHAKDLWSIP